MKTSVRMALASMLLILLFCALLLGSGPGLWLVQTGIQLLSGGSVAIGEAEGALLGHFSLGKIRIVLPGADIRVEKFDWDWSPAKLFEGELRIADLDASGVVIGLRDSPARPSAGGPVMLPRLFLPLGFAIDRAAVKSLQLQGTDGSELIAFDSIDVQLEAKDGHLGIGNLSLQGPEIGLAVHGRIDFDGDRHIDLLDRLNHSASETRH